MPQDARVDEPVLARRLAVLARVARRRSDHIVHARVQLGPRAAGAPVALVRLVGPEREQQAQHRAEQRVHQPRGAHPTTARHADRREQHRPRHVQQDERQHPLGHTVRIGRRRGGQAALPGRLVRARRQQRERREAGGSVGRVGGQRDARMAFPAECRARWAGDDRTRRPDRCDGHAGEHGCGRGPPSGGDAHGLWSNNAPDPRLRPPTHAISP
eukprot:4540877-Prymnesium_polylepis.1